ncbi:hypothetical protein ACP70R_022233 [Stipagrostis hirtigluma subsp. patula]
MAAMAMRPVHLALICLALLARAATAEHLLVHSRDTTTSTLPLPVGDLPLASDGPTGWLRPASTSHHHPSAPSSSTLPRRLDVIASAPTAPPAPPCPCPCRCGVHTRASAVDDIVPVRGSFIAPARKKALLRALPLLAVPFLPPPVSALVALSALATPVRAWCVPDDTCPGLAHATCSVYRYLGDGTVDRAQPVADMRSVCPHPHCNADSKKRALSKIHAQCRGRHGDPLHSYCAVRTLEMETVAEGNAWRIMPVHLPIADPDAVVAGGGEVCYVELEHMNYREGYYIRCPARACRRYPVVCCTEFPHDAVAAAVWDHRRLTYSDTVAWYNNATAKAQHDG